MRPRLEVVPQAARTAQGADGGNGWTTSGYSTMFATSDACFCGPGRTAGQRYTCTTCARFARYGRQIEERAPHLHQERRRWA